MTVIKLHRKYIEILMSRFFFDTSLNFFWYCNFFDACSTHVEKFGKNYIFRPFFIFFLYALLQMSRLIVAIEEHYLRRVSQRATTIMPKIKAKFEALGLNERAINCPFKQFFLVPDVKFSRVLIHQLLLRKVKSKESNEMHFLIGGKVLRFGLLEFALMTGLNFGQYPNLAKIIEMSISRRLVETYMNGDVAPKLIDLGNAFLSCEDGWKLGLEGLLLADEPTSKVNLDFLSFVEDAKFFFFFSNILGDWTHITRLTLVLIKIYDIAKETI